MRHETRDMRHTLLAALMTLCAVTVATAAPTGVTVNGVALDSAGSGGEGWKYYLPHITLTNAGPFTISGTNKTSQVRVVVQEGVTCDVTISNLVLEHARQRQPVCLRAGDERLRLALPGGEQRTPLGRQPRGS